MGAAVSLDVIASAINGGKDVAGENLVDEEGNFHNLRFSENMSFC